MRMNEEMINDLIDRLDKVVKILTKEIPIPDMDVIEWNGTPVGRAVGDIGDVMEILQEAELD